MYIQHNHFVSHVYSIITQPEDKKVYLSNIYIFPVYTDQYLLNTMILGPIICRYFLNMLIIIPIMYIIILYSTFFFPWCHTHSYTVYI